MCFKTEQHKVAISTNYFIKKRVNDLGIMDKYLGFFYILEIMNLLINDGITIRCFSKEVYPELANKYNVNESSIERDIRNVIKVLWEPVLKNKLKKFWRYENRPTCCKFLYLVKNYVISDLN